MHRVVSEKADCGLLAWQEALRQTFHDEPEKDPYVVVWRHRGRQHTETYRTFTEAREAKGDRERGEKRPTRRVRFEDYFSGWIESYSGRTARGFSETSRVEYRRVIQVHVLGQWGTWKLADVEPADVRELLGGLR